MLNGGSGGAVVNLTSMAAVLGGARKICRLCSHQGAIDAMTVGLSKEYAYQNIRVNAVRPGLIKTDMQTRVVRKNRATELLSTVPVGTIGTAEEVAETIGSCPMPHLIPPEPQFQSVVAVRAFVNLCLDFSWDTLVDKPISHFTLKSI